MRRNLSIAMQPQPHLISPSCAINGLWLTLHLTGSAECQPKVKARCTGRDKTAGLAFGSHLPAALHWDEVAAKKLGSIWDPECRESGDAGDGTAKRRHSTCVPALAFSFAFFSLCPNTICYFLFNLSGSAWHASHISQLPTTDYRLPAPFLLHTSLGELAVFVSCMGIWDWGLGMGRRWRWGWRWKWASGWVDKPRQRWRWWCLWSPCAVFVC